MALLLAPPAPALEKGGDSGLWSRLGRIETAFRQRDAAALRASCARVGKVRLDLADGASAQGSYGAGQLQVIFGQIFGRLQASELTFSPADVSSSPSGTAFVQGRWARRGPNAASSDEMLTFTLREEAGDWRVHEIRSSR